MSTPRVRTLVVAGPSWDASAEQLALAAEALHTRSLPVEVAAPYEVTAYWQAALPGITVRALERSPREHRRALRSMAAVMRANVAIVDHASTRRLITRVLPSGSCVLQRLPLFAAPPAESFLTRVAPRGVSYAYLVPQLALEDAAHAQSHRIFRQPVPLAVDVAPDAERSATRETPVIVVVPDAEHPMHALPALRAAVRLVRRHPSLRVHLLGPAPLLQGLKVQAAALRIADHVTTGTLRVDRLDVPAGSVAVWIAADGDVGAAALLQAMTARLPTLLSGTSALAPLIADRVTGVLVNLHERTSDAVAAGHLARLIAHDDERRSMGAAARARAQRLHSSERLGASILAAVEQLQSRSQRAA